MSVQAGQGKDGQGVSAMLFPTWGPPGASRRAVGGTVVMTSELTPGGPRHCT